MIDTTENESPGGERETGFWGDREIMGRQSFDECDSEIRRDLIFEEIAEGNARCIMIK